MTNTVFTALALAPLLATVCAVIGTLVWYAFTGALAFAAFERAIAAEEREPVKSEIVRVVPVVALATAVVVAPLATLQAYDVDGMRILANSYADAVRIAAE